MVVVFVDIDIDEIIVMRKRMTFGCGEPDAEIRTLAELADQCDCGAMGFERGTRIEAKLLTDVVLRASVQELALQGAIEVGEVGVGAWAVVGHSGRSMKSKLSPGQRDRREIEKKCQDHDTLALLAAEKNCGYLS